MGSCASTSGTAPRGALGGGTSFCFTFFRGFFRGIAADQSIEIACFSTGSFVLHHECQVPFVELFEPLIPGDFFQRLSSAVSRKIEPDHAYIFTDSGAAHA
ncbi:MAG TPA: hypothetical protein VGU64_06925 [Terriglobales bacterium]|nr:hypothetical protein [Terriglobales bacterium]